MRWLEEVKLLVYSEVHEGDILQMVRYVRT